MCSGMMTVWILGEKYEGGLMERIYKFQGTCLLSFESSDWLQPHH
jgi:hypothetical protein